MFAVPVFGAEQLPFSAGVGTVREEGFCDRVPRDRLCGHLPHDITDFRTSRVYVLVEGSAQDPFDRFAWRTFVALNWPLGADPSDPAAIADDAAPRTWQNYPGQAEAFGGPGESACAAVAGGDDVLRLDSWLQAGGYPLVDRRGNYLLYDVRINPVMAGYIRDEGLDTLAGQHTFFASGNDVAFPMGRYDNAETRFGGDAGSIAIKSSWRVLPDGEEGATLFTRDALVSIPAASDLAGEARCLMLRVGLVGMHVVRRIESATGEHWIWATFEHRENAPMASAARGPNAIFGSDLFPEGCRTGDDGAGYALFDADCPHCLTNQPPAGSPADWKWARGAPFARYPGGAPVPPAQVARCWHPAVSTAAMNREWQDRLAGTVWQHYALSTVQWKGAAEDALFPAGEVPRYQTNTTMETYIQADASGSCLGCHVGATSASGHPSNSSFVLQQALRAVE